MQYNLVPVSIQDLLAGLFHEARTCLIESRWAGRQTDTCARFASKTTQSSGYQESQSMGKHLFTSQGKTIVGNSNVALEIREECLPSSHKGKLGVVGFFQWTRVSSTPYIFESPKR